MPVRPAIALATRKPPMLYNEYWFANQIKYNIGGIQNGYE